MLKLSTKGQYGVRAMFEIAKSYPHGPITIKEIAERQEVSVAYLEQILNKLRRDGLIKSHKGPGGGYVLSKKPDKISVSRILRTLEGPITITQCLNPKVKSCNRVEGCVARLLWKSLGEKIEHFLETISLSDLMDEESRLER
ncbi:MAG: RrF2 family transcriptional regulator [Nitrospirae bacterium]|nr:RrF2 family transcriptional regulator [Nitrospirota bacterium]